MHTGEFILEIVSASRYQQSLSPSDFLCNLLVLLLRILNSGLSDSGLLMHLSEATAGSLNGGMCHVLLEAPSTHLRILQVGHSTAYEEREVYS
jgi:hypothetical protein